MSEWPKPEFEVPLQEEAKQTQAILENLRKVKPEFNSPEFEGIKNEAGLNRFVLSEKHWVQKTRSKGIIAKAGRYGGTYAQSEIGYTRFAAFRSCWMMNWPNCTESKPNGSMNR